MVNRLWQHHFGVGIVATPSDFGAMGEALARNARKGDQLFVEARVRANSWTDKQGEKKYDHSLIVDGFRFGAPGKIKREELDGRREQETARAAAAVHGVSEL